MANRKKSYNLAEAVDFILNSDNEYMDEITSEEESEEEIEPCFRVSAVDFVDEEDIEATNGSPVSR